MKMIKENNNPHTLFYQLRQGLITRSNYELRKKAYELKISTYKLK